MLFSEKEKSWRTPPEMFERLTLGRKRRKETAIWTLRTMNNARTLPSVKITIISDNESWCPTYVRNALETMNGCYVGKVLGGGHIELLGEPAKK